MSKIASRLLTFFIGLPIVITLVFCSALHHIGLLAFVACASILTANELYDMFAKKYDMQNKKFVMSLASLLPLSVILCGLFNVSNIQADLIFNTIFVFSVLIVLGSEVVVNETFEKSNSRILTSSFIIFYASYLITFLARMTWLSDGHLLGSSISKVSIYITYFFLVVYLNDSLAWVFGMLFGKNNKGFIKASPNKSLAGFAGGFVGSVGTGILAYIFFPSLFQGSILKIIFLSLFMGIVAIFGDLVESVLKRSCDVKDSGDLIPGRGGVLDSVDSIIFAAPVFYLAVKILYLW